METATMTNTQVVQEAYGYFGTGNIPALLNLLSEDIKWIEPGPKDKIPFAGVHLGREAVGRFFSLLDREVNFLKFEPREFIEQGNKVVALGYMEGKSKRTGKLSQTDWAMVFTLKNGKVVHFQEFSDTYEGAKAFGE
jgi:ketosteroid isomerase-like protein